ncbi:MAG: CapA family protein [Planctomycetes bacterium]|nr:CapA family protein [Planctomycetota bacterium]
MRSVCDAVFVGDIAFPRGEDPRLVERLRAPSPLREILGAADLVVANLESPCPDSPGRFFKIGPRLCAPACWLPHLRDLHVSLAFLANNHIADGGRDRIASLRASLERLGIASVGAGRDLAEAREEKVMESNGIRIAIIARSERGTASAGRRRPGAADIDVAETRARIRRVRRSVDHVVVVAHIGYEFVFHPAPFHRDLARAFIDAGATAFIAHHPHVPQGYERYRDGFIAYSQGNFFFNMGEGAAPEARLGYLVRLRLGRRSLEEAEVIPYEGDTWWFPRLAEGDRGAELRAWLAEVSREIGDDAALARRWRECARRYAKLYLRALWYRTVQRRTLWYPVYWLYLLTLPEGRRAWLRTFGRQ